MLEHLNELEIYDFVYNRIRLDFVEVNLVSVPVLKKVRLSLRLRLWDERVRLLKFSWATQCASAYAEVQVLLRTAYWKSGFFTDPLPNFLSDGNLI
ncbi:hypothetical protein Tco_1201605 [Tanacetum coccineum]